VDVAFTAQPPLATAADTVAVGVFDGEDLRDDPSGGALRELLEAGEASGRARRLAVARAEGRRFILVGLGHRSRLDPERAREIAAAVHGRAGELGTQRLCWQAPDSADAATAAALVEGTLLHAYRFERYKPDPEARPALAELLLSGPPALEAAVRRASVVARAQNRARDLGNTPANDLRPEDLAAYAQALGERHAGLTVTVRDEAWIAGAGMGAFAAVAQGSDRGARLIELDYTPAGASGGVPLLALLGKAVTFDSGGLSLKQPASMHEMKFDMMGGAAVIETFSALAELGVPVRVLGVVGATENLPSGRAVKPGDIVRALDGTTIEVNNTDAEGRLVLADCLCHARRLGAERLVDLATLTGAIVTALGSLYAGLFSNDDEWARALVHAGRRAGEPLWRMPLHPEYARMVEGRYAQLTNRTERREAASVTAAEFLHHFAGEVPWAHLDIAGTAYDAPRPYLRGKGATGFGVRLLVELVQEHARSAS
jgi:leucyl aminopeptidase